MAAQIGQRRALEYVKHRGCNNWAGYQQKRILREGQLTLSACHQTRGPEQGSVSSRQLKRSSIGAEHQRKVKLIWHSRHTCLAGCRARFSPTLKTNQQMFELIQHCRSVTLSLLNIWMAGERAPAELPPRSVRDTQELLARL